jgi:hypothetical protein
MRRVTKYRRPATANRAPLMPSERYGSGMLERTTIPFAEVKQSKRTITPDATRAVNSKCDSTIFATALRSVCRTSARRFARFADRRAAQSRSGPVNRLARIESGTAAMRDTTQLMDSRRVNQSCILPRG